MNVLHLPKIPWWKNPRYFGQEEREINEAIVSGIKIARLVALFVLTVLATIICP